MNQGFFNSSYQSTLLGDVASELSEAAAATTRIASSPDKRLLEFKPIPLFAGMCGPSC